MSARAFRGVLIEGVGWRDRDYSGQRVGVIAPGREAACIVPAVARTARSVKVFQEHPDWVVPMRPPRPLPRRMALDAARLYLRLGVKDAWTRRLLTPDRRFNQSRPTSSPSYYRALAGPHCTLITWPVYAIVPDGVRTAEGIEHHVDCLVIGSTSEYAGPAREPITPLEERTA